MGADQSKTGGSDIVVVNQDSSSNPKSKVYKLITQSAFYYSSFEILNGLSLMYPGHINSLAQILIPKFYCF